MKQKSELDWKLEIRFRNSASHWSVCRVVGPLDSIFLSFLLLTETRASDGNFNFFLTPLDDVSHEGKIRNCLHEKSSQFNRFPYGSRLILRAFHWFYDGHRPNDFGFIMRAVEGLRNSGSAAPAACDSKFHHELLES